MTTIEKRTYTAVLRDSIMKAICEGDVPPEIEDAVNVCYDYIYGVVDRVLEDVSFMQLAVDSGDLLKIYDFAWRNIVDMDDVDVLIRVGEVLKQPPNADKAMDARYFVLNQSGG